jgi:hypothetical protein
MVALPFPISPAPLKIQRVIGYVSAECNGVTQLQIIKDKPEPLHKKCLNINQIRINFHALNQNAGRVSVSNPTKPGFFKQNFNSRPRRLGVRPGNRPQALPHLSIGYFLPFENAKQGSIRLQLSQIKPPGFFPPFQFK